MTFDRQQLYKELNNIKKKYGFIIEKEKLLISFNMSDFKIKIGKKHIDKFEINCHIEDINIDHPFVLLENKPMLTLLMPVTHENITADFKYLFDIVSNNTQEYLDWYISDIEWQKGCKRPYIIG